MTVFRVEKLARDHAVDDFDCGSTPLDQFLQRHALGSQQSNAAVTYLGMADTAVVGYCSLAVSEARSEAAPERLSKGLARHPVPLMLLARLAVHRHWQARGIGSGLLKDAMLRTLRAACRHRRCPRVGCARKGRPCAWILRSLRLYRVAHGPIALVSFDQGVASVPWVEDKSSARSR